MNPLILNVIESLEGEMLSSLKTIVIPVVEIGTPSLDRSNRSTTTVAFVFNKFEISRRFGLDSKPITRFH